LQGKRIGVEKSFLKVHEGVDRLLETALDQMKSQGATIIEVNLVERLKPIGDHEYTVLQYEFKDGLNRYLANVKGDVKSLKDVIAFNTTHADKSMPYFQQEILEDSQEKGNLETGEYQASLNKVVSVSRSAIDDLMQEHNLNCIVGPATGAAWCTDLINGDAFSGYGMSSGPAMAGYPSITLPLGDVHGLPVGLLFMAKAWQEAELFAISYVYEQISKNRQTPKFKKALTS
jgi:amidase